MMCGRWLRSFWMEEGDADVGKMLLLMDKWDTDTNKAACWMQKWAEDTSETTLWMSRESAGGSGA